MTQQSPAPPAHPAPPTPAAHRGEQTGKRDAEERNDPAVQPGAREGQPDARRRRDAPDADTDA